MNVLKSTVGDQLCDRNGWPPCARTNQIEHLGSSAELMRQLWQIDTPSPHREEKDDPDGCVTSGALTATNSVSSLPEVSSTPTLIHFSVDFLAGHGHRQEELAKTVKQLGAYKKANAKTKAGMGNNTYKHRLEGRIKVCEGVIARSTIDSNVRTLGGSPNDPIPPGGMWIDSPIFRNSTGYYPRSIWWSPSASLPQPFNYNTPDELLLPMAWSALIQTLMNHTYLLTLGEIDPALLPPPTKKSKTHQPKHRKLPMVEPLDKLVATITARMLATFVTQWRTSCTVVESVVPASTADTVPDLRDAAIKIIDHVVAVAEKEDYSDEDLNWTMENPMKLMDADIQQKALPVVVEKGKQNRRLGLNPDVLKLIASAIQAASGHEIETLLQPATDRLEYTAHWALKELTLIADQENQADVAASLRLLATKLKETMIHWEKERDQDDDCKQEG
ncbi:hypothetical protein C8R47DRAFT_1081196 [Mycena vitilis]|nr:hypothetical protein C8R47DRAFT_1081196 [Mycena vitilis]